VDRSRAERVLAEHFESHPEVTAAYLFGSVAAERSRPDSDVDVGVLYRTAPPTTLLGQPYSQEAELSGRLGCPVQLVVMNGAPVDLVHRILRDGVLLVEHDKSARIAFEVRARSVFFDLLPVLREYRMRVSA
jgi:predicted nucleotidyltransferase